MFTELNISPVKRACVYRLNFTRLISRVPGHIVLGGFHLSGLGVTQDFSPVRGWATKGHPLTEPPELPEVAMYPNRVEVSTAVSPSASTGA